MTRKWHTVFLGFSCAMAAGCVEDAGSETMLTGSSNEDTASVQQREVIACPSSVATDAASVVFAKELVITHVAVVEDPCRTKWNPGVTCTTSTQRKWHFWYLMQQMAGANNVTRFVLKMLESIESWPSLVNGMMLQPRTKVRSLVIDSWMHKTNSINGNSNCVAGKSIDDPANVNCQLDPGSTPLRLLAIVNRIDARPSGSADAYYSSNSGEGRFVFGFFNWDAPLTTWINGEPPRMNATIILEYKLPTSSLTPRMWATNWHALGSSTVFDENYNGKLQALTDKFSLNSYLQCDSICSYGPNKGTAINQVRVNDFDFDQGRIINGVFTKVWSLREFKLSCLPGQSSCGTDAKFLLPNPVAQTPANTSGDATPLDYNEKPELQEFMTAKAATILAGTHDVPLKLSNGAPFRGAEATSKSFGTGQQIVWKPAGWDVATQTDTRRLFAFSTCNGCHYAETETANFHIQPRNFKTASQLSNFLQGSITTTSDPSFQPFPYDEAGRRACELVWLKAGNGTPVSTVAGRPH